MDVCVRLYCDCAVLCIGSAFQWADPPSKESYRLCIGLRNLKKWPRSEWMSQHHVPKHQPTDLVMITYFLGSINNSITLFGRVSHFINLGVGCWAGKFKSQKPQEYPLTTQLHREAGHSAA
jgi:hypothetical protein